MDAKNPDFLKLQFSATLQFRIRLWNLKALCVPHALLSHPLPLIGCTMLGSFPSNVLFPPPSVHLHAREQTERGGNGSSDGRVPKDILQPCRPMLD